MTTEKEKTTIMRPLCQDKDFNSWSGTHIISPVLAGISSWSCNPVGGPVAPNWSFIS